MTTNQPGSASASAQATMRSLMRPVRRRRSSSGQFPDGESFAADSAGGRQTVVVDGQVDGLDPPDGEFGVTDWTVTEQQPTGTRRWRVSLSLTEL